jgi:hypothetical protein
MAALNQFQLPQMQAPDVLASLPKIGLPMAAPSAQAQPQPMQQQAQASYPGLKRPPPAVGAVVNGYVYQGGDPRSKDPSVWKPATGDAFLNSLPIDEDKKTLIKMMANYEAPSTGTRGIGTPEVQQLVGLAKQYDPTFDVKNYTVRQNYLHDLNDLKANGTIQALNNAAMHLKSFDDEFQKLGNSDGAYEWFNSLKQGAAGTPLVGKYFGGSDRLKAVGAAGETAAVLGPEMAKVAQGGAPTVDEVNRQISNLGLGMRPSTEAGVGASMAQKIGDRLLSMQAQYRRAFGDTKPKEPFLTPQAAMATHQLLQKYAPDYEKQLDYTLLTAGGFTPEQARRAQQPQQSGGVPQGVDPAIWQHMTPQERALWGK